MVVPPPDMWILLAGRGACRGQMSKVCLGEGVPEQSSLTQQSCHMYYIPLHIAVILQVAVESLQASLSLQVILQYNCLAWVTSLLVLRSDKI